MVREIKFRGKDIQSGEWRYGYAQFNYDKTRAQIISPLRIDISAFPGQFFHVDKDTVCQFTGLCDKNGKEIYEGDIVRFHFMSSCAYTSELFPTKKFFGEITTNKYNQWTILSDGLEIHIENAIKYGEVIGNIFDNPELLEE